MEGLTGFLDRLYQGFVLRDLLGFVAPGSISLLSLAIVLGIRMEQMASGSVVILSEKLSKANLAEGWQLFMFFAIAYLWAWILQALLYVFINLIGFRRFFGERLSQLNSICWTTVEGFFNQSPATTQGALQPDIVLAKSLTKDQRKNRLLDLPYAERLSALIVMSGNLCVACVVLAVAILLFLPDCWLLALFMAVISLLPYYEHWRLWVARNLLIVIYATEFKKGGIDSSAPKEYQGGAGAK